MTKDEFEQVPCIPLPVDDSQFRCTVCGSIGTVGRCCGLDTREPLNDMARAELVADEKRKANAPRSDSYGERMSVIFAGAIPALVTKTNTTEK